MKHSLIFKLTGILLIATLAFCISPASAGKNKLERVVGVIVPTGGTNTNIPFPPNPQFTVTHPSTGIFLIAIEERFTCILMTGGTVQAAKGSRLASPNRTDRYTTTPLVWFPSLVTGICNETAVYQITVLDRANDSPADSAFSFQIIGSRTNK